MEVDAEGTGEPHRQTVYLVGDGAATDTDPERPTGGRLRPLSGQGVPRRHGRSSAPRSSVTATTRSARSSGSGPRERAAGARRRSRRRATTASRRPSHPTRSGRGSSGSRRGSTRTRAGSTSTTARWRRARRTSASELSEGRELFGEGTVDDWRAAAAGLSDRARHGAVKSAAVPRSTSSASGPVRRLVRALPPLVGWLPGCCGRAAGAGGARLRHRLPAARASDRRDPPQGPQQHRDAPARATSAARGRSAATAGGHDALHPDLGSEADFDAMVAAARRGGGRARARLRDPVLARPPVARRASGVVPPPPRRHAQVRREPAQALPGHPQRRLGHRRAGGALARALRRRARLVRARDPRLPGRQPAHEADAVLGVADRRGARRLPRGRLPRRGVHAARADDDAREDRLRPVVHVLHVEEHEGRARRVRRAGALVVGVLPAEHVAEHARHPPRVPPGGRAPGLRGAARARRHPVAELRDLLRATRPARTSRCARAARSTSTPRSTRSRSARSRGRCCR